MFRCTRSMWPLILFILAAFNCAEHALLRTLPNEPYRNEIGFDFSLSFPFLRSLCLCAIFICDTIIHAALPFDWTHTHTYMLTRINSQHMIRINYGFVPGKVFLAQLRQCLSNHLIRESIRSHGRVCGARIPGRLAHIKWLPNLLYITSIEGFLCICSLNRRTAMNSMRARPPKQTSNI